jgi:esterase/lipase superfamily enzyme
VELSTSGSFFAFLPRVNDETVDTSLRAVLAEEPEQWDFEMQYDMRPSIQPATRAVLLYVHGFNCPMEDGMKAVGALVTMGNLQSRSGMKPIVFSWPTGRELTYWPALWMADQWAEDFVTLVQELIANGFEEFHILAHSAGVRALLGPALAAAIPNLFERVRGSGATDRYFPTMPGTRATARLETMTLVNADFPRSRFIEEWMPLLQAYAGHTTIYSDRNDIALWLKEVPRCLDEGKSLGRHVKLLSSQQYGTEAVDVLDCSCMEHNVHRLRHSYFSYNIQIIEDIAEMLTDPAKRAASRRFYRLVRSHDGENVFSFLCPPSHWMAN